MSKKIKNKFPTLPSWGDLQVREIPYFFVNPNLDILKANNKKF